MHENVTWESAFTETAPVVTLEALVAFLDRARIESGAERYDVEVKSIAEHEGVVLSQRIQKMMDKDGEVLGVLDVMALTRVLDGKIVWNRDYIYSTQAER